MIIEKGEKGPHIVLLQGILQKLNFPIKSDGIFGDETEEAIRSFQYEMSIKVDGKVGQDTADNLVRALIIGRDEVKTV